jgi:ubiquinol-cytochrome c reductase cytochrome b subunit
VEGGQSIQRAVTAESERRAGATFEEAAEAMKAEGAQIVMVDRSSPTDATLTAISGGQLREAELTAHSLDELEAQIAERKAALGAAGVPYVEIERNLPFEFTVTRFAQILTAYYFLFFLVILPLLGLRETPGRVPETIAKSIRGAA